MKNNFGKENSSKLDLQALLREEASAYNQRVMQQMNSSQFMGMIYSQLREQVEPSQIRFILDKGVPIGEQLYAVFLSLKSKEQDAFKSGTLLAIQNWQPSMFTEEELEAGVASLILLTLLSLVSNLRLVEAIPSLLRLLNEGYISPLKGDELKRIYQETIAILGGFAQVDGVLSYLELMLNDPRFVENAPTLLVALCKANTQRYSDYLLRFLDIFENSGQGTIDLNISLFVFSAVVRPEVLQKSLLELDLEERERIIHYLCDRTESPYKMVDINNFVIEYKNPEYYPLT